MSSDFEDYVRHRGAALSRLSWLLTGDHHDGEDLLQGVLVALLPRWERVTHADDVDAYVRRALVNASTSRWRSLRRRREHPVAQVPDIVATGPETAEADRLLELVRALPAGQRAVIVLRYYEQRSESDIAQILGCSEGTVKSQASKGRAKLRAAWTAGEGSSADQIGRTL